ncbi:Pyruvate:Oxaloacetate transcarboxylase domain protein [Olavius algarvensis Delta 1 endosymbiont]|nr:Pyruvate:Oxaloacetate transcarboxylase domain protein [Olavius algarvensis Delta 1 endosymbiont]
MFDYPKKVIIEEQGLRDGLQNEKIIVPPEKKLELINAVVEAGVKRVQVTSFVHPERVPQMADAEAVCRGLKPVKDVIFTGLVLNTRGIERAAAAGLKQVEVSISASDTHSRKNANASLAEAREQFVEMVKVGQRNGLTIRGGLQCVFGCRFEGRIDPGAVLDLVKEQQDLGIDEIALADSTGMANPNSIQEISAKVMELAKGMPVFLHLHDTEGKGLANALAALQVGVSHFDTAFGGMGGCPFIKGASGNISTEDFVLMLGQMGVECGIDIDKIAAISRSLEDYFAKPFSGKMHRVLTRSDIQIVRYFREGRIND